MPVIPALQFAIGLSLPRSAVALARKCLIHGSRLSRRTRKSELEGHHACHTPSPVRQRHFLASPPSTEVADQLARGPKRPKSCRVRGLQIDRSGAASTISPRRRSCGSDPKNERFRGGWGVRRRARAGESVAERRRSLEAAASALRTDAFVVLGEECDVAGR